MPQRFVLVAAAACSGGKSLDEVPQGWDGDYHLNMCVDTGIQAGSAVATQPFTYCCAP